LRQELHEAELRPYWLHSQEMEPHGLLLRA
jgi:hypothetical protein